MRRLLAVIIGSAVLGLALAWGSAVPALASTLPQCLAQQHVCVSADGRALVTASQQTALEQQIGSDDIYLVAAAAGSSGYNAAMQQLISSLRGSHRQFVVGFLDSGQRHFGAYNQGVLPAGGAAGIATTIVNQHKADGNIFAALQEFVQDVKQQAGSPANGGGVGAAPSSSSSSGVSGGLIAVGVIILAALGGYFFFLRPRRQRSRREQAQQLAEAKAAAQDDLIALNQAITDDANDVSIASSPDAVAEQTAALDAYERGTRALDAARSPADMGAVSRSIAEGRYRLACAQAVAHGEAKPGRRPMCFFDPRHGMSVADVSWAPPDGGPSRDVAVCLDCERIINRGDQPRMRHRPGPLRQPGRVRELRFRPGLLGRLRLRRTPCSPASCWGRRSPRRPSSSTTTATEASGTTTSAEAASAGAISGVATSAAAVTISAEVTSAGTTSGAATSAAAATTPAAATSAAAASDRGLVSRTAEARPLGRTQ